MEQRHASEHVQRPIAANGPAPRSGESIRLLRLQCCGLNREQSVDPFDRLSFARNHIVIGSPSKSAFTPMDPGARTHPGRDALRILLIARLLSNIGANYRRTTVTPSASERYNSSLPSQTIFGGCRFPVPGIKIPDFARSSGSCGHLRGKICPRRESTFWIASGFKALPRSACSSSLACIAHKSLEICERCRR